MRKSAIIFFPLLLLLAACGEAPPGEAKKKEPEKPPEVPKKKDELPQAPPTPTPGDVRVAILAGDAVQDGRFYLIDGDAKPKTFEEFKEAITARRKESKAAVVVVFRFAKEPLSESHPAVRQAVAWVNEVKLLNRFE